MVFQWAVRVSQRLQSRSLQSGAIWRFGLVQIVMEASRIRGVSQTLGYQSLYMTGAVAACFDGYEDELFSQTHRQHHIQNLELHLCYTLKKSLLCVRLLRHSMRAADVASTTRSMSLGRSLLVACFSSVKITTFRGLIFFQVSLHTPKNPFASLGRSYTSQKNRFAIGRIPNVVLTTQIYQYSSFPSATRQHWISHNLSDSRIPQIWAKSKKLWKRANLTEKSRCSSKEPLQSQ